MSKFEYNENDPRSFAQQYEEWQLCRETKDMDIKSYPGTSAEQFGDKKPTVVTKRERKQ